ncbi:MAG: hypothetical protein LCH86_01545 [Proteobacteria bacterium]|nr:hypothetical protein [Pseudomonadota bacterium]
MRKPNYDFERSQREKAKEAKAREKLEKKQEKKQAAMGGEEAQPKVEPERR